MSRTVILPITALCRQIAQAQVWLYTTNIIIDFLSLSVCCSLREIATQKHEQHLIWVTFIQHAQMDAVLITANAFSGLDHHRQQRQRQHSLRQDWGHFQISFYKRQTFHLIYRHTFDKEQQKWAQMLVKLTKTVKIWHFRWCCNLCNSIWCRTDFTCLCQN